ncbi:hypothetical protein GDO78_016573 [Eleutherodactylus coqui]|uniref:sphingomyelin phosphodiesterase n=1 Tax=Eleutherodactylus coqui TaxID=57060 RepID=A0A8J6EAE3_ELECQ|nr:hypothetical protein GDO78_016573 [Eleutherodactylus coqui]
MPLAESPFSCRLLDDLFLLSCVLVFPSYWFIDRLLSCVVSTSVERSQGPALRILLLVFGALLFALLFVLSLPLCVFGLLLWAPLHQIRRPFSYQRSVDPRDAPERTVAGGCSFTFRGTENGSACGPDGGSACGPDGGSACGPDGGSACGPDGGSACGPDGGSACGPEDVLLTAPCTGPLQGRDGPFEVSLVFPQSPDFLCLQEVFDGRASRKLRRCLSSSFPYILYDVGPSGPHGCGFKFFNSGLFLASRHPLVNAKYYIYPNARGEDALASKGLLCVKVYLGTTQEKQSIVGFMNCTHLHAPECDAPAHCDEISTCDHIFLSVWVMLPYAVTRCLSSSSGYLTSRLRTLKMGSSLPSMFSAEISTLTTAPQTTAWSRSTSCSPSIETPAETAPDETAPEPWGPSSDKSCCTMKL